MGAALADGKVEDPKLEKIRAETWESIRAHLVLLKALEFTGNENGKADPFQDLQLHIIAAVAQFERELIKERQREGIAVAKRNGRYKGVGRKSSLAPEQITHIRNA